MTARQFAADIVANADSGVGTQWAGTDVAELARAYLGVQWRPIETAPNSVFDVIAKHWDASLDMFLNARITNCFLMDADVMCARDNGTPYRLVDEGYRATHWMPLPEPPE